MTLEGTGGHELAQLVADHILGDVNGHVLAAVVDGKGVAHEGGEDGGTAAPGLQHLLLAGLVLMLLKSAAANAENNHQMDPEKLYVSSCYANPGPIIKRIMPRAQGRAYRINKRTSHVTVAVSER